LHSESVHGGYFSPGIDVEAVITRPESIQLWYQFGERGGNTEKQIVLLGMPALGFAANQHHK
jgi:hypothetical protein